jgi:hypothetical protein
MKTAFGLFFIVLMSTLLGRRVAIIEMSKEVSDANKALNHSTRILQQCNHIIAGTK